MRSISEMISWAAAFGALLLGCGGVEPSTREAYQAHRAPAESCREPGPAQVSPEAMRADWQQLERVLRRGYAGFSLAGDEAAWAEVFADGRDAIGDAPRSAIEWRDFVVDRMRFADDNHFTFWVRGADRRRRARATSAHRFAYVSSRTVSRGASGLMTDDGFLLERCGERPASEVLRPAWDSANPGARARAVVLSEQSVDAVECEARGPDGAARLERFELHRAGRARSRGRAYEPREEGGIPWVRLRSLGMGARGDLERFVESARELRDAPVFVLDVRGNGGGSDTFLLHFFAELTSDDLRYFDTRILTSEVELQGALTFWTCMRQLSSGDAAGRAWMDARVARAERALETGMRERGVFYGLREADHTEPGRAETPYRGRLILLTDRGCGSACETSVLLARQLPNAVVVGENTEGTMKVGELRYYRLAETGLWLSAGRRAHFDPEQGVFPEGRGYLPDLWLDGTESPEEAVATLAQCLGDAECAAQLE